MNNQRLDQTDHMVGRDKSSRAAVALILPPIVGMVSGTLTWLLLAGISVWTWLAVTPGVLIGLLAFAKTLERAIINNDTVEGFVTVDALNSLTGGEKLVTYGPGVHFCFPWEQRSAKNVVYLGTSDEEFKGPIQCKDGLVNIKGSFRLRANICDLPAFISGLGSMAGDFSSLFIADLVNHLSKKEVRWVLKNVKDLNDFLKRKYIEEVDGTMVTSDLEKRYGILLEDVTISEITADKELTETIGVQAEMKIIAAAVINFICTTRGINRKEYKKLVATGDITKEEQGVIRDRIMAASGNLQGMRLGQETYVIDIRGLDKIDPELAKAVTSAAQLYAAHQNTRSRK